MVDVDYLKEAERVLYARPALDIALNNLGDRLKSYDKVPDCEHISSELSELLSGSPYHRDRGARFGVTGYAGLVHDIRRFEL